MIAHRTLHVGILVDTIKAAVWTIYRYPRRRVVNIELAKRVGRGDLAIMKVINEAFSLDMSMRILPVDALRFKGVELVFAVLDEIVGRIVVKSAE